MTKSRDVSQSATGKCCLCPLPIMSHEDVAILYAPGKRPGAQVACAHTTCLEKHPIQYLNLMKAARDKPR